jgi:hypothetical protein
VGDSKDKSGIQTMVVNFLDKIDTKKMALSEISNYCKSHQTESRDFFVKFRDKTVDENVAEGYFDKKAHELNKITGDPKLFAFPVVLQLGIMFCGVILNKPVGVTLLINSCLCIRNGLGTIT